MKKHKYIDISPRVILMTTLSMLVLSIGVSLMMKGNIGVPAWSAFNLSLTYLIDIKVGSMTMITNFILFIGQIIVLKKDFNKIQYLQVLMILFFGSLVNIFYYNIFTFELNNYISRMISFLIGIIIVSISVALLLKSDSLVMPPEGFSNAVSKKTKYSFSKVRFYIDVVAIIVSVMISLLLDVPLTIREGTIISMLVFNGLIKMILDKF